MAKDDKTKTEDNNDTMTKRGPNVTSKDCPYCLLGTEHPDHWNEYYRDGHPPGVFSRV